jgi:tRNA1(Val) A37 N6-methylase TrmN6
VSASDAARVTAVAKVETVDAFLGGRVEAVQPKRGHHRSGLEAVLLAASLDQNLDGLVVDLGAGAGVVGLCAAARSPAIHIALVEREPDLHSASERSLKLPANRAFAGRVHLYLADIADRQQLAELAGKASTVLMNPPFNDASTARGSPSEARRRAHIIGDNDLVAWCAAADHLLRPGGRVTAIFRADGLHRLLDAIGDRFGTIDILPIHPRVNLPAHRVMVSALKGGRAPQSMLPPLVLHGATGSSYLPPIERVLRDGAGLDSVDVSWRGTGPQRAAALE